MSEWWTYRLSDFLLFSSQTYYRLFELYNKDIWPIQLLALALGAAIIILAIKNPMWQGRVIAAVLVVTWLWVAWAYHLQHYATINWAAIYFAAGFAVEAVLLLWAGTIRGKLVFRSQTPWLNRAGVGIFIFALVGYPLMAPLFGRKWVETEIFGVAPDPTAIGTLGLLLLATNRGAGGLLIIPVIWCALNGAILSTMGSPDAFIVLFVAFVCLALAVWNRVGSSARA